MTNGHFRKLRRSIMVSVTVGLTSYAFATVLTQKANKTGGAISTVQDPSEAQKVQQKIGSLTPTGSIPPKSPIPKSVPRTIIGINLSGVNNFGTQRVFANLLLGSQWYTGSVYGGAWSAMPTGNLLADGNLREIPAGNNAYRGLVPPDTGPNSVTFRCTWTGRATVGIGGTVSNVRASPNEVLFDWVQTWAGSAAWLGVNNMDPSQPIRNVDCREASMNTKLRLDPTFVSSLRDFKIIRFMDFKLTNDNATVSWRSRNNSGAIDICDADGVSIEDIVTIASSSGADAWFNIPWNASDDYIRGFAQLAHDRIPKDRKLYVETSNEVWNGMFLVATQAQTEGLSRGLSSNPYEAQLRRYAQRSVEVMKIWESVFSDAPSRLVRVVASQNGPWSADTILAFPGVAEHSDALAAAPYFGYGLSPDSSDIDLNGFFAKLNSSVDGVISQTLETKQSAARAGKRFIAYEGGQHVILPDVAQNARIQRDPRMGAVYSRFLNAWHDQIGDSLLLYSSIAPVSNYGAWGLREYPSQTVNDAPKYRAAFEAKKRWNG